jgi:YbbR domain-containing protein
MDRLLQNSNVVKLIAFVLAIILWFVVSAGDSNGTGTAYSKSLTNIPVTILSDPNQIVVSNSVTKVNAILTGGTFDLTQLQPFRSIQAVADIRGYTPGVHQVALTLQNVPESVHYQIIPDTTTVTIAQRLTRTVSVKVGVVGRPGKGYVADTPTTNVTNITVSGSQDAVNRVANVQAVISIEGAVKTIQEDVPVMAVDADGKQVEGVELSSKSVFVKVPIHTPAKDVLLQAVTTGNVKNGYMISKIVIDPDHATVSGSFEALEKLESSYVLPAIDVTGLDHDKTYTLQLQVPSGASDIKPSTVNVTVKVVQAQSTTLSVPIRLTDIPDGMQAKISGSQTVDVTVSGDASQINHLTNDSIQVSASLQGLSTGTHSVPLKVMLPDGFQLVSLSTTSISVSLQPK